MAQLTLTETQNVYRNTMEAFSNTVCSDSTHRRSLLLYALLEKRFGVTSAPSLTPTEIIASFLSLTALVVNVGSVCKDNLVSRKLQNYDCNKILIMRFWYFSYDFLPIFLIFKKRKSRNLRFSGSQKKCVFFSKKKISFLNLCFLDRKIKVGEKVGAPFRCIILSGTHFWQLEMQRNNILEVTVTSGI